MDADSTRDAALAEDQAALLPTHARTEPQISVEPDVEVRRRRCLNRSVSSGAGLRRDHTGLMLLRSRSHAGELLSWVEGHQDEEQNIALESALEEADGLSTEPSPEDRPVETFLGFDQRPLLPLLLYVSMCVGALLMLTLQRHLWAKAIDDSSRFLVFFGSLYAITIGCMFFVGFTDPGMMSEEVWARVQAGSMDMPLRAHKNWHCHRPVLRFDHYCRWVNNCIGLWNHRPFLIMCTGFVIIGGLGACVDLLLIVVHFGRSFFHGRGLSYGTWLKLLLHLAYSVGFTGVAGPIFRLHIGFISRNELAYEWKNDMFYVVFNGRGQKVPVAQLEVDDYNEKFDFFLYEPTLNSFDRGTSSNLETFWLTSRSSPNALMGEF